MKKSQLGGFMQSQLIFPSNNKIYGLASEKIKVFLWLYKMFHRKQNVFHKHTTKPSGP